MNSYSLGITGSWLFAIILILLGFSLTVLTYRKTLPPISSKKRILLIALRTIAISLLLFALFEPVFTTIRGLIEKPKVAILLDNSLSAGLQDATLNRAVLFKNAISNSQFMSMDEAQRQIAIFDEDVKPTDLFNPDSFKHNGQFTDISKAIRWASQNQEKDNVQAALLITDGAFNSGNNPVYDADLFGKPIYIIGIGDTTEPKDISVQSIITNDIAYVDNPIPINVNVRINGFSQGEVKLELKDNNNKFAEQIININTDKQDYSTVFEYNPKIEGIHKISASINILEGEITSKNNSMSEFINVLDNKRNILIFAGSPSPDLTFIKNSIESEKGAKVTSFVQKKGPEFYNRPPSPKDLNDAEIIILVDFPINSTPQNVIEMIKNACENDKSIFFISSQYTDYSKLKYLENFLPFNTISSKPLEFLVIPDIKPQSISNPLLRVKGTEEDIKLWNQLPPIFKTETFVRVKPESEVVSTFKVNSTPMKEPLILTRSFQNKKSIAILGHGLYRWKLLGYAAEVAKGRTDTPDLYDILIGNSIRWLSVTDKSKMVKIKTTKKIYTNNEKVEFIGQVYDASYSPVDNANVIIKISGGEQIRELILNSMGNGQYKGLVEGLPSGDYAFSGDATVSNKKIGSDNGRFSIGEISLEYQNLRMNSQLLRSIAQRTGGKFYTVDESNQFLNDLKNSKSFVQRSMIKRSEYALWSLPWILGIAILFFGIEWFIRKRSGLV